MARSFTSKDEGIRLSIDWIHNLVYYNENHEIIVFKMTNTTYGFLVVKEECDLVKDFSVDPLTSSIFYSTYNKAEDKGSIIKVSQDGSNRTVLRNDSFACPEVLSIDLGSKKIFWMNTKLNTFSSIDFDGMIFEEFGTPEYYNLYNRFMQIFGPNIYWAIYYENALFRRKHRLSGRQKINFIKSEIDGIGSFIIIDSALQPNSPNRCTDSNCSHLCIPISINQYHCVCPHFGPPNDNIVCIESVSIS